MEGYDYRFPKWGYGARMITFRNRLTFSRALFNGDYLFELEDQEIIKKALIPSIAIYITLFLIRTRYFNRGPCYVWYKDYISCFAMYAN